MRRRQNKSNNLCENYDNVCAIVFNEMLDDSEERFRGKKKNNGRKLEEESERKSEIKQKTTQSTR